MAGPACSFLVSSGTSLQSEMQGQSVVACMTSVVSAGVLYPLAGEGKSHPSSSRQSSFKESAVGFLVQVLILMVQLVYLPWQICRRELLQAEYNIGPHRAVVLLK